MIETILGLLGGNKVKIGIYLVILLVLLSGIGYHFWELNNLNKQLFTKEEEITVLKSDLEISKSNQDKLKDSLNTQKESIILLKNQREIDQAKIDYLSEQYSLARNKVSDLRKKLSKHDLTFLTINKPGLIETRINHGTDAVGKELEELTK